MKNTTAPRLAILSISILAVSTFAQNEAQLLPQLAGGQGLANDINNNGEIVGQSINAFGVTTAAHWDADLLVSDLGALDSDTISWAEAINNNGEIVGYSENETSGQRRAAYWDGQGGMVNVHSAIGSGGSSIPWDINDDGVIVGQAMITAGIFPRGFVWDQVNDAQQAGTDLYPGGANYGINNAGHLVGSGYFFGDPDDALHAVPDGRGGYEYPLINPLGFYFSQARAVNEDGLIVGHSNFNTTSAGWNACIFTGDDRNPVQTLGTLPGLDTSEVFDVNNSGMIVGYAWDGSGQGLDPHAFVYTDGVMYDLNDWLPKGGDIDVLLRATGINDQGDIVGWARSRNGDLEGFLIEGFVPPASCQADLNADGVLNFFDVSAFLQAFGNLDDAADFDSNGEWNFFDVSAFLSAFGTGCP